MRFIKLAVFSAVVLFFIITAIGLLLPSTVKVSRTISINASHDTTYHYINDVKYWKLWMQGAEENTITFLSSRTAGIGTVAKIGTNQVSIEKSIPTFVETKWKGESGSVQTGGFNIIADSTNQSTTVNWYFEQHLSWYPWERLASITNEKILGPTMEQSLDNLKQLLEK